MIHLKTRTTFSLKKSTILPSALIKQAKKEGCEALAITELGNIYSAIKIFQEAKKEKIKPILGIDLYVQEENGGLSNLTLLCKNKAGWGDLLKIVAKSNSAENFNPTKEIATIKFHDIADLVSGQNFVVYSGCLNSFIIHRISDQYKEFIRAESYEAAKSLVNAEWKREIDGRIGQLQEVFGAANVFLENNSVDNATIFGADIVSKIINDASTRHKIPSIATCKPHYLKQEGAEDLKILICVDKKASFRNIGEILKNSDDIEYDVFFKNNAAYLYSKEEYEKMYPKEYLENNKLVASLCEDFNILSNPKMPEFKCPDGLSPDEYLNKLCQDNWGLVPKAKENEYRTRYDYEMKILKEVGLPPYFLVVHDLMEFIRKKGGFACGRGSAGGSLVAYLLNLVESDPIQYDLIFERFYNAGRNQPGKISLPDVDTDVPVRMREAAIAHLYDKYGSERTANIATFGSLKGAGALKEVLRTKNVCDTIQMNSMTKLIIDEHKIADELEELRKAGEDASIIGWSLDNIKDLHQYAFYNDDGELCGDYAQYFTQAIRLEGCKRTLSKHAGGIVVSAEPLTNYCAMVRDKSSDKLMVGWEMGDVESAGGLKLDVLGVAAHDDIMETIRLMNEGDFRR